MALNPTPASATQTMPPMQAAKQPATQQNNSNVFIQQATSNNTSGNFTAINEDGAAMPAQASFNVHALAASNSTFVYTASAANMKNGTAIIDNALINNDPNAIIFITQLWNPGGGNGVYNSHPVGVAFNGSNWEIVNEDQTPIPQGASFAVVIVKQ